LQAVSGSQLDPEVVFALLRVMGGSAERATPDEATAREAVPV
jgi:HD-GYP domain-containing protein (c-di-GMP phosphodiesterase class II)